MPGDFPGVGDFGIDWYIITDYFVSYYTAQNSVQQAVSVATLMHVRALHGMTLFRPSILTDVFAFSKQRAIQLLFALENLPCSFLPASESTPEARLKSYVNRCHISAMDSQM